MISQYTTHHKPGSQSKSINLNIQWNREDLWHCSVEWIVRYLSWNLNAFAALNRPLVKLITFLLIIFYLSFYDQCASRARERWLPQEIWINNQKNAAAIFYIITSIVWIYFIQFLLKKMKNFQKNLYFNSREIEMKRKCNW